MPPENLAPPQEFALLRYATLCLGTTILLPLFTSAVTKLFFLNTFLWGGGTGVYPSETMGLRPYEAASDGPGP